MISLRHLTVLLALAIIGLCAPVFATPNGHGGIVMSEDYAELPLLQGWYDGQLAWYIFLGTNNIDYARTMSAPYVPWFKKGGELDYALFPKLTSALYGGSSGVFFVTNFQQGPVFTARPGQDNYSALWQVWTITWKPGVTPRPITSANDLPCAEEADIVPTDVIMDLSIMIIGQLRSVAAAIDYGAPAPCNTYYTPQIVKVFPARLSGYPYAPPPQPNRPAAVPMVDGLISGLPYATVVIPTWPSYAQDPVTKKISVVPVVITDTADPGLAMHLQANLAPALDKVDNANTEILWYFRRGQTPPLPMDQYLVMQHPVTLNYMYQLSLFVASEPVYKWARYWGYNTDFDASPVMNLQPLVRGTIPPYTTVKTPSFIQKAIQNGVLLESGPALRVNVGISPLPPVEYDDLIPS